MTLLFIGYSVSSLKPVTRPQECCNIIVRRTVPCMAKKRSSTKSNSKSKQNRPKPVSDVSDSVPLSSSTNDPIEKEGDNDSSSVPFIPRGPTLRAEYERRGLIEPAVSADAGVLPEKVANRMLRRMLAFGGVPLSFLFAFFAAYFVLKFKFDITVLPGVVASSTLGTVGLATVGITYGIFSSSWDEQDGSLIGWEEAKTNFWRAKDGLVGARERELLEDEFDRIDQMEDEK